MAKTINDKWMTWKDSKLLIFSRNLPGKVGISWFHADCGLIELYILSGPGTIILKCSPL
jgi:hypothetical protein